MLARPFALFAGLALASLRARPTTPRRSPSRRRRRGRRKRRGGTSGSAGAGAGGSGAGGAATPTPGSYSLAFTTSAGKEDPLVPVLKMQKSETGEVLVTGWKWTEAHLHHWAVYQTTADVPAGRRSDHTIRLLHSGCDEVRPAGRPAPAARGRGRRGELPPRAGFSFASEEIVLVQAHTVNVTAADVQAALGLELRIGQPQAMQTPARAHPVLRSVHLRPPAAGSDRADALQDTAPTSP